MDKTRIAVLVSGGGTNLQALIDAEKSGVLKSGEIVLVLSNKPGAYALKRAADAGIRTETVEKRTFPTVRLLNRRSFPALSKATRS